MARIISASLVQTKGVGSYLRTHVGRVPRYDTTKIQRDLGMRFMTAYHQANAYLRQRLVQPSTRG